MSPVPDFDAARIAALRKVGQTWAAGGRMIRLLRRLLGRLACAFGNHDYTSLHEQGIPPDPERVKADPEGYFWEYAALRCKRCPWVSIRT